MRVEETVNDIRLDQLRRSTSGADGGSVNNQALSCFRQPVVEMLPCQTADELHKWAERLQHSANDMAVVTEYFRLQGGNTAQDAINRCLRSCAVDEVYEKFSLRGKNLKGTAKIPFSDTNIIQILQGEFYSLMHTHFSSTMGLSSYVFA